MVEIAASDLYVDSRIVEEMATKVRLGPEPVDITFLLGFHKDEDDFPMDLRTYFETANVVLHEQIGWRQTEDVDRLNDVASGRLTPEDPMISSHPLIRRRLNLIRDTAAGQGIWDVALGHTQSQRFMQYFGYEYPNTSTWDTDALRRYMNEIIDRDRLAVRTLGKRISDATVHAKRQDNPKKVLVNAGVSHIALANAVRLFLEDSESGTAEIVLQKPHLEPDAQTDFVLTALRTRVEQIVL